MEYQVIHKTVYEYTDAVTVSHHAARLQPVNGCQQTLESFDLKITPHPDRFNERRDYFGNSLAVFSIRERHARLVVKASSRVAVQAMSPPVGALSPKWTEVARRFRDPISPKDSGVYEFCMNSPLVRADAKMAHWALQSFGDGKPLLLGVEHLMGRMFETFIFDSAATEVATPLEVVWEKKRGVCQDFAHIGIACLRSLGIPARYVSGYIRTIPPEGQTRLQGADASHAWLSVFCPLNGWVDFDPTNNMIPADGHVRVAVGRDFSDVSPLNGVLSGGGNHEVYVEVDVIPLSLGNG